MLQSENIEPTINANEVVFLSIFSSPFFKDNEKITSVVIPEGVTGIYNLAFSNCTGLTKVDLADSITIIHTSAFVNCTGLTTIRLPDNISKFGFSAFSGCTNLTSVEYKGVTYTSQSALYAVLEANDVDISSDAYPFADTGLTE